MSDECNQPELELEPQLEDGDHVVLFSNTNNTGLDEHALARPIDGTFVALFKGQHSKQAAEDHAETRAAAGGRFVVARVTRVYDGG